MDNWQSSDIYKYGSHNLLEYNCVCGSKLTIDDKEYWGGCKNNTISLNLYDRQIHSIKNHEKTKKHKSYISEFFDNLFK